MIFAFLSTFFGSKSLFSDSAVGLGVARGSIGASECQNIKHLSFLQRSKAMILNFSLVFGVIAYALVGACVFRVSD